VRAATFHHREAEAAILGAILVTGRDAFRLAESAGMSGPLFGDSAHRAIWEACAAVVKAGGDPDVVAVVTELERRDVLGQIGGYGYPSSLTGMVADVGRHSAAVLSAWRLRESAAAVRRLMAVANASETDDEAMIRALQAEAKLAGSLFDGALDSGIEPLSEYVLAAQAARLNPDDANNLPRYGTGIRELDGGKDPLLKMTRPGDKFFIGGRPSMGKTTLLLGILKHISDNHGPTFFASRESSKPSIGNRADAYDRNAGKSESAIGTEWIPRNMHIADRASGMATIDDMARMVRVAHAEYGIVAFGLDYLQKFSTPKGMEKAEKRVQYAYAASVIADLADDLGVLAIPLVQLNRGVEQRTDRRPMMSDIRECGEIEEHADTVMMVYRDGYYTGKQDDHSAELIIRKQRDGATGTAMVHYEPGRWFGD